ncbi:MAG: hypothetical protein GY807_21765 [Gammaproteobacteria bacterium]|nr:hypothetical protein [Gammaproteobacteria bacterium]
MPIDSEHLHHLIPRWLMTLTAMRPDLGLLKGLEVSLLRVTQASWRQRYEFDLVFLMSLLHASGLEVFQDHAGEVCFF